MSNFFLEAQGWTPPVGGGGGGGVPDFDVVVWESGALTSDNIHIVSEVAELDGAVLISHDTYSSGTLIFTATFSGAAQQHIGFAVDMNNPPFAIVSSGDLSGDGLIHARTIASGGAESTTTIVGASYGSSYTFKLVWTGSDVKYYLNNVLKVTHVVAIADAMNVMASDFSRDTDILTVSAISVDGTSIIL